jgi:OMF family outer membrane factor
VVKRQQLFNSFYSSLTLVILGTQPAGADSLPISAVQFKAIANYQTVGNSPRVFTSNSNKSLITVRQLPQVVQPSKKNGTATDNRTSQANPSNLLSPIIVPSSSDSDIRLQQEAPRYLNPNPNPLQFPTRPEEVRIQGTQPITLQQALDLARRNNRQLQVAELTLERSRAALREAQAAEYPTFSINSDLTRSQSASGEIQADLAANQPLQNQSNLDTPNTVLSGTAQLTYNLYTAGERSGRIRAAQEQIRFNQLDVERVNEQLRLDVSTDYYNLQAADELVRINRAAVTNAEASLRDTQALEQAGVGTRFDVLRSQVQLANATQDLTQALGEQLTARRQLAQRLSIAQSVNVSAADPVEISGLWNLSLEESIVLAFQNRAELAQQLAQRNISQQQRRIALSQIRPRVGLVTSYDVLDVFNDSVSLTDGYSVGARFSWNLFDGGAARARARQEESNIAIAETNFADTRNQIRFQVEQAYADLQSNLENIQTASVALEQAREALRLARLRFQAGVGTQTDVINAENDLTNAEGNRVTAILDYNRALASLQRAISSGQPR